MKKLISFVLVAIMLLSVSVTAMAAGFTPSVINKGAPDIVFQFADDGKKILGYIRDTNGNIIATCYEDCIVVTPISGVNDATELTEEEKKTLQDVYAELVKNDAKLSVICPELNDLAKDILGSDANADNFVIRDLFDVTAKCDDLKTQLSKNGTTIDITFDCNIPTNTGVIAMVFADGKWKPVNKVVNNNDGTITVTFDEICPVAIMVPADAQNDTYVPVTGSEFNSNIVIWGSVMLVSLASIVALAFISRRKRAYNA